MSVFRGPPRVIPPDQVMRELAVRPGVTHWVTKDGRRLRPEEMEQSHRLNTLSFAVRAVSDFYHQQGMAALAAQAHMELTGKWADDDGGMVPEEAEEEADECFRKAADPDFCYAQATRRWPVLYKIRLLALENGDAWTPASV